MVYLILIFVLLCFYCFFIFLFKSNRENEEHVYDDLLAVCSSNEQISGSLQEILFFSNDSCFYRGFLKVLVEIHRWKIPPVTS